MPKLQALLTNSNNRLNLSDEDLALVLESLRIARLTMRDSISSLERVWPSSMLIERLRLWDESAADLAHRLELA